MSKLKMSNFLQNKTMVIKNGEAVFHDPIDGEVEFYSLNEKMAELNANVVQKMNNKIPNNIESLNIVPY